MHIDEVCTQKAISIVEQTTSIILKRPLGKNTMNEIIELIKNQTLEAVLVCALFCIQRGLEVPSEYKTLPCI